jgi:hypothetical protein
MTKITTLAFGSAWFLCASLAFACDYPDRPHIPDGATAEKEKLLAAKSDVQRYVAAVDEYLICVENEVKAATAALDDPSSEDLQRREEMLNKKFDAANEEKALVGEQFNQQIRVYNKRLKESRQ